MNEKKVLARVEEKEITIDKVQAFISQLGPQGQQFQSPEGIQNIAKELVNQELLYLDAKENGLDNHDLYKEQVELAKEDILKQYAFRHLFASIDLKDEDILDFYEGHKEHYKTQEKVRASHILVDSEEKAKDIIKEIEGGKSFEDAAKEYSSCPSKEKGGDLGEFGKGQMVGEFEEAAFNLDINTLSQPVKTNFGYHIIKVVGKVAEGIQAFETIKEQVRQQALGLKQQEAYVEKTNNLKDKYEVETYF